MNLVNPETAIVNAEPGTMIWAVTSFDGGPREVALFIHEEPKYIATLGDMPALELRAAAFQDADVVPIAVMLRFSADMLYETWINACADAQTAEAIAMLGTQDRIAVVWFTDKRVRQVAIPNRLQIIFANFAALRAERPAWGNPQFERARNRLYQHHSTPAKLWRELRAK